MISVAPRDLVRATLGGHAPVRLPLGELVTELDLVRAALGLAPEAAVPLPAEQALLRRWGHDLVVVPFSAGWGAPNQPDEADALFRLGYWQQESDLFVFALVDGPFSVAARALTWEQTLVHLTRGTEEIMTILADTVLESAESLAAIAAAGAEGIIIGDDIAYRRGPYVRPDHLRRTYFPYLTLLVLTCQDLGLPVVFHSDGNLWPIWDDLLKTGVNGIHGLDPASAMSLALARQRSGPHLCLWGNLDLGWLAQPHTDEAILAHLHDQLDPVLASPVILGTCSWSGARPAPGHAGCPLPGWAGISLAEFCAAPRRTGYNGVINNTLLLLRRPFPGDDNTMIWANIILAILLGYSLGSIPFGYLFGRLKGVDVRQYGSGRTGGTNVYRAAGTWVALLTGLFDVLKGVAAVLLARQFLGSEVAAALAGAFAVCGHNWSIFFGLSRRRRRRHRGRRFAGFESLGRACDRPHLPHCTLCGALRFHRHPHHRDRGAGGATDLLSSGGAELARLPYAGGPYPLRASGGAVDPDFPAAEYRPAAGRHRTPDRFQTLLSKQRPASSLSGCEKTYACASHRRRRHRLSVGGAAGGSGRRRHPGHPARSGARPEKDGCAADRN